jgi:hypothetical protein
MDRELIDRACKKLTEEAAALKNGDPCKVMISEYLMDKVRDDASAGRILAEGKTLKALNGKMWSAAKERKAGNGAHVPDAELMQMADEYYGLDDRRGSIIDITDMLV